MAGGESKRCVGSLSSEMGVAGDAGAVGGMGVVTALIYGFPLRTARDATARSIVATVT